MDIMKWDDSMSVKISSIDYQHKQLIGHINTFYEYISKGMAKEKMLELIKVLKEYTLFHFSHEERLMKQYNFDGYQAHKNEHEEFVKKVLDFEDRYKNGKMLLTVEITRFLKDWVTNHIMGTDHKYSEFLVKCGVK